jgi:hypothetical protein
MRATALVHPRFTSDHLRAATFCPVTLERDLELAHNAGHADRHFSELG